jgi:hypothetical protein
MPSEIVIDGDDKVWRYQLGKHGDYKLSYEILIRNGHVVASWWNESLTQL